MTADKPTSPGGWQDLYVARAVLASVTPDRRLLRKTVEWCAQPLNLSGDAIATDTKAVMCFDGLADALGLTAQPPSDHYREILTRATHPAELVLLGKTTLRKIATFCGPDHINIYTDDDGVPYRESHVVLIGGVGGIVVDASAIASAVWLLSMAGDCVVRAFRGILFPHNDNVQSLTHALILEGQGWRYSLLARTDSGTDLKTLTLDPAAES